MLESKMCLKDDQLIDYLGGWLGQEQQESFDQHLGECADCQQKLEELENTQPDALSPLPGWIGQRMTLNPQTMDSRTRDPQDISDPPAAERLDEDSLVNRTLQDLQQGPPLSIQHPPMLSMPDAIGQYRLIRSIGCGGMAEVYLALHDKLKKSVAIKILHVSPAYRSEALRRLEREIEVVGQLNHPAIVAATDAGEYQGQPYLVTEYIEGLDLSQLSMRLFRDGQRIATADACELIRQACLGMDYAHSQSVVHRDLKPSNLMLDHKGRIRILDFGLGHWAGQQDLSLELTSVGQLLGTLDYMSPEQAEDANRTDHRSDLYSLGATLFRLLTGRVPYGASSRPSPFEKLRLLATQDPVHLATLRPDLPPGLCQVVDQCLRRLPEQRPASAAHLAESLTPFCQEADLIALVEKAKQLPEVLPRNIVSSQGGHSVSKSIASSSSSGTTGAGKGGRWGSWIATAVFGFGFLLLAIVLILKTQTGQLVIRSDQANVTVQLLKEGQHYQDWKLKTGDNQTTLFAGNYEIKIDGQAQEIQLDHDQVQLRRGQVVIATIQKMNQPVDQRADQPVDQTASSPSSAAEPMVANYFSDINPNLLLRVLQTYYRSQPDVELGIMESGIAQKGSQQSQQETAKLLEYISSQRPEPLELAHGTFQLIPKAPLGPSRLEVNTAIDFTGISAPRFQLGEVDSGWLIFGEPEDMQQLAAKMKELEMVTQFPAQDSVNPSTAGPTQPVYHGKTMDYWMAILRYEQEPSAQLSALEAIVELNTPETNARVSQAIVDRLLAIEPDTYVSLPTGSGSRSSRSSATLVSSILDRSRKIAFRDEDCQRLSDHLKSLPFEEANRLVLEFLKSAARKSSESLEQLTFDLTIQHLRSVVMDDREDQLEDLFAVFAGISRLRDLRESQWEEILSLPILTDDFLLQNFGRLRDLPYLHPKAIAAAMRYLPADLQKWKDQHGIFLSSMRDCIPRKPGSRDWEAFFQRLDSGLLTLQVDPNICYPTASELERRMAGMLGSSSGMSGGMISSGSGALMGSFMSSGSLGGDSDATSLTDLSVQWHSPHDKETHFSLRFKKERAPVSIAVIDFLNNVATWPDLEFAGVQKIQQGYQQATTEAWDSLPLTVLKTLKEHGSRATFRMEDTRHLKLEVRKDETLQQTVELDANAVLIYCMAQNLLTQRGS